MEANTTHMVTLNWLNYAMWNSKMENLIYVKSFHQTVFDATKLNNKTIDRLILVHTYVCGYICQWVDDNILNYISGEIDANSLCDKLKQLLSRRQVIIICI